MASQTASLPDTNQRNNGQAILSSSLRAFTLLFASVRLTVLLLSLLAATVLVGAWCPQEAQVGQEKVIEAFGPDLATILIKLHVADIFHSYWFLLLIGLLTVNIIVGSLKHVFPKLRLLVRPMPVLQAGEIAKLPFFWQREIAGEPEAIKQLLFDHLRKQHYSVSWTGPKLTAEFGKFGRLAPSITHVGLLTLLAGVTITAWTGFSGFQPILVGSQMSFAESQHANPWLGKLPSWKILVNGSRREDYDNGEAKQWYSSLSVVDDQGKKIKTEEISVNNPLSYQGVDIYQSSWGLGELQLEFNGHKRQLNLRPMGKLYATFLPLAEDSVLIFSVRNQKAPLRIFAKRPDWQSPRLLAEVQPGKKVALGSVVVRYVEAVPITGLQYKCDPGLAVTFTAFGFIILGVLLTVVPHRQIWAEVTELDQGERAIT
ncbi:MAG: hypothetical protein C5B53_11205, partial [Candidatus Melainabacteria bacterium]